jgi:hypothetical protein
MRKTGLTALLFLVLIGHPAARMAETVSGLLDRYSRGQFDEAVRAAAAVKDVDALVSVLTRQGPNWSDADRSTRQHRRLAIAAFTLELTHARMQQGWSEWQAMRPVLEWACTLLRTAGPPTDGERRWHLAVISLAGRVRDYGSLSATPPGWAQHTFAHLSLSELRQRVEKSEHLAHAWQRFPNEPRILLAAASMAGRFGADAPRRYRDGQPVQRQPASNAWLTTALAALQPLADDPGVGVDVMVREGRIQYALTHFSEALALEQSAAQAAHDSPEAYLAHFLAGRALEAMNDRAAAVAEFERAAAIRPRAQSAALAVAYDRLLASTGSAAAAVMPALASHDEFDDPWRLYDYGDYMYWPERLSALREALK